MLAGIRDILLISTPSDLPRYAELLGDGSRWGISIRYEVQQAPNGLAEAFVIGRDFVGSDSVCLVLGDNIFYGDRLRAKVREAAALRSGAIVFGYRVRDPERYGVVTFDSHGQATSLEEKPAVPKSNYAVTGMYFYDNSVLEMARSLAPSPRGELEITDVNRIYMDKGLLQLRLLGRGFAWLDTGTHESMLQAAVFMQVIEQRQGLKVACLEEIALREGWVEVDAVAAAGRAMRSSGYGQYLLDVVEEFNGGTGFLEDRFGEQGSS
jgi:glucose-1-phosphate thymidylyltransferase